MAEAALSSAELALENQRIGGLQIRVAILCTLVQICDGYDVGSIGWEMAHKVQGFGCRPVEAYPTVLTAGFRKPPRKEPAGAGWPACGLWRFAGAASCVGDALAGVVGVGPTIAVSIWSSRRRSMG